MPMDLSFQLFPLLTEASVNENTRPGALMLEYFQAVVTIGTNTGDAEIPTLLGEVLGIIPLSFNDTFGAGDNLTSVTTDAVITSGAITVRAVTVSIADGPATLRGFIVGRKAETVLSV